jgi:flagellar motor switch protein FliN/FliY
MVEGSDAQTIAREEWDNPGSARAGTTAIESPTANPVMFREFSGGGTRADAQNDISLVLDIPVQLNVELGRTRITIKNLLQLTQGTVVELDGLAGGPMNVLVNGCLIAKGEVVVVDEKFGIRLTEIVTPSERIGKLDK